MSTDVKGATVGRSASPAGRPSTASSPMVVVLVALVIAIAFLLRFVAIGQGLPWVVGADEGFEIHRALELGRGVIDLERTAKGGFFYLLFMEYGLYYGWLRITGAISSPEEFAALFANDITPFWMIARVTHALVGVLVVFCTFLLGRRAYGELAGLIGASIVALSTILVIHSHFVGVDLPMTALALLTLMLLIDWSHPEGTARPWLSGALLGGAAMTKLPAVLLGASLAVAQWLRGRGPSALPSRLLDRKLLTASLVAVGVFVVGNPGVLLNAREFAVDTVGGILLGSRGAGGDTVPEGESEGTLNLWLYYPRVLASDLGLPLALLVAAALLYSLVRHTREDLVLLSFTVPLYVVLASARTSHLYYPRYLIPILAVAGILVGRLVDDAARRLPLRRTTATVASLALIALALAGTARRSFEWLESRTREDTRVLARRWFHENVPPGSKVFLIGNPVVATAPNLSLPLRNLDSNLRALAAELGREEPLKARILELRSEGEDDVAYDLVTARHNEALRPLAAYLDEGVRYFALTDRHFAGDQLQRDRKHALAVRESRDSLYRALLSRGELVFAVEADERVRPGPGIMIFALPAGAEAEERTP